MATVVGIPDSPQESRGFRKLAFASQRAAGASSVSAFERQIALRRIRVRLTAEVGGLGASLLGATCHGEEHSPKYGDQESAIQATFFFGVGLDRQ